MEQEQSFALIKLPFMVNPNQSLLLDSNVLLNASDEKHFIYLVSENVSIEIPILFDIKLVEGVSIYKHNHFYIIS